jgi:glycosyltransferase involved in cell wall biosynthesis
MRLGVSVVICCYNSCQRLSQTLAHLAAQQVRESVQWEVIVVDNASTDETSQVALTSWPVEASAPLRVVYEPQLGLSYARYRGYLEAKYEIISFVDDDNWVCPEWVQLVSEIMSQHPELGACGGLNEAKCEVTPPEWFEQYKWCYAVGAQGQEVGDITCTRGYLWGAGLNIRKSAWQQLLSNGFRTRLSDRQGVALTSGGDSELCMALHLAGWRLWYEPRLRLYHYVPAHRLEWGYLRRLCRGFGRASAGYSPYYYALRQNPENLKEQFRQTWQGHIVDLLKNLLTHPYKLLLSFRYPLEGDPEVLVTEQKIGQLLEVLRTHKAFNLNIREVRDAPWKQSW